MKKREQREFLLTRLKPLGQLLSSEKCTAWLISELHPEPAACPACREIPTGSTAAILETGRRIRCPQCGKGWTIWSGTLFEGSKIAPEEFVLLRTALAAGMDSTGLKELTGRRDHCIRAWCQKIEQFNEARQGVPADGRSIPTD